MTARSSARGPTGQRAKTPVEVVGQLAQAVAGGNRVGSHDEGAVLAEPGQAVRHQIPQPALDLVPGDGVADRPADDEAHPYRLVIGSHPLVQDDSRRRRPRAATDDLTELRGATQPVRSRKHRRVKQQAGCGPCAGGRREWRGRHECASADGSRGSCADGGCSAGTCAWSRVWNSQVWVAWQPGHECCGPVRGAPPLRTPVTGCGHAATLDSRPTRQRYAPDRERVKLIAICHAARRNPLVSRCEPKPDADTPQRRAGTRTTSSLTCGQRVEI